RTRGRAACQRGRRFVSVRCDNPLAGFAIVQRAGFVRRPGGRRMRGARVCGGAARIEAPTRRVSRHELAAPIQLTDANGKTRQLGVLRVYRASDGMAYTDSDCTLLELFASQAAIVIENADL